MSWDRKFYVGHLIDVRSAESVQFGLGLLEELWNTGEGPVARDDIRRRTGLHGKSFERARDGLKQERLIEFAPGERGRDATRYKLAGRRRFPHE